jgi:hypothetical protein
MSEKVREYLGKWKKLKSRLDPWILMPEEPDRV